LLALHHAELPVRVGQTLVELERFGELVLRHGELPRLVRGPADVEMVFGAVVVDVDGALQRA
jgi:hypothetical protein